MLWSTLNRGPTELDDDRQKPSNSSLALTKSQAITLFLYVSQDSSSSSSTHKVKPPFIGIPSRRLVVVVVLCVPEGGHSTPAILFRTHSNSTFIPSYSTRRGAENFVLYHELAPISHSLIFSLATPRSSRPSREETMSLTVTTIISRRKMTTPNPKPRRVGHKTLWSSTKIRMDVERRCLAGCPCASLRFCAAAADAAHWSRFH